MDCVTARPELSATSCGLHQFHEAAGEQHCCFAPGPTLPERCVSGHITHSWAVSLPPPPQSQAAAASGSLSFQVAQLTASYLACLLLILPGQQLFPLPFPVLHRRKTAQAEMETSQSCCGGQVIWGKIERCWYKKRAVCVGPACVWATFAGGIRGAWAGSGRPRICRTA